MKQDVAVVITCFNLGRTLREALDSVLAQTREAADVLVVDDGSTDLYTKHLLSVLRHPGVRVIRTANQGVAASRATGVAATTAPYILLLDADDVLEPAYLERTAARLDARSDLSFVTCGTRDYDDPDNVWSPPPFTLIDQLARNGAHISTLFRRIVWETVGPLDARLTCFEDVDFWARAVAHGFAGEVVPEPLLRYRRRPGSRSDGAVAVERYATTMAATTLKHRPALEADWQSLLIAKEEFLLGQRAHTAGLVARRAALQQQLQPARAEIERLTGEVRQAGRAIVEMDDLRRGELISDVWGLDRGVPIDRLYIEAFLERHARDVVGDVCEVKDAHYTHRYGGSAVRSATVVDINPRNPDATLVGDLADAAAFPADRFDCFICTQTLTGIEDPRAALATACKMLKPGGVLLCTVSAVNRVSPEDGGADYDFWRFTEASLRSALADVFPLDAIEVESFGNAYSCTALLYGLSTADTGDPGPDDPRVPLIIAARARKPVEAPAMLTRRDTDAASLVLMYHRISDVVRDPVGIATPAARFASHLDILSTHARVVPLEALLVPDDDSDGRLRVALTFDDGTVDHLEVARMLSERGLPATYFVTTAALDTAHEHYWDRIEAMLAPGHVLPPAFAFALNGQRHLVATATEADREAAVGLITSALAPVSAADRERVMAQLVAWSGRPAAIREGYRALVTEEVASIDRLAGQVVGAHTCRHLVLTHQPTHVQVEEILGSRLALERVLGRPVTSFAYPFGVEDRRVREVVRSAGLTLAVGVAGGGPSGPEDPYVTRGADTLCLPRVDARHQTPERLLAMLTARSRRVDRSSRTAAS